MSQAQHFDVIIIGTGAGGGTLAYALAPSGKRILLLERGDYVPREKDNWNPRAVNVDGKYQTKDIWRNADGKPLHPHTNYNVGGNTKFYGAALFRLRREDFGEIKHSGGIHRPGHSPMPIWNHTTPRLSNSIRSMAGAGKIPLSRQLVSPFRTRRSATNRASNS